MGCEWFESQAIPYMVFGGVANSYYGNPRQTFDIDVKILLDSEEVSSFIQNIAGICTILPEKPSRFVEETGVLPVDIEGVRTDIVFAELPFEKEAIERSRTVLYLDVSMRMCTLEDLILQKAVSTRDRDWMDIERLVELHREDLDWAYVLGHASELAAFLDRSEIRDKLSRWRDG